MGDLVVSLWFLL